MTETTIGVDISKDHLDAHRLPDDDARRFANTAAGYRAFRKWAGPQIARIVYEPTGPYHGAFDTACAKAGLPLCKVNPKMARRFAEAIGLHAKTDTIDARMLARMGETLALHSRPVADETSYNSDSCAWPIRLSSRNGPGSKTDARPSPCRC